MNNLMKRHFFRVILVMCVFFVLSLSTRIADAGTETDDGLEVDVVADYNADNTGNSDATDSINKALQQASNIQDGKRLTVIIPAGQYRLDGNLFIYSNTNLILDPEAEMINNKDSGSMIKSAHFIPDPTHVEGERCKKEDPNNINDSSYRCEICSPSEENPNPDVGYSLIENVVISGGKWDAKGDLDKDTEVVLIRHGTNITLKDTEIYNFTNHAVNISGCKDVTVENVKFHDAQKYDYHPENKNFWPNDSYTEKEQKERYRWLEALHFDFCSAEAEAAGWPQDNTAPKNITVKDCSFEDVYSGIGTHHLNSKRASIILVENCSFEGLLNGQEEGEHGWPVLYKSVDGFEIKNCGTDSKPVSNVNDLTYLEEATGVSIHDNVVSNTYRHGVCLEKSSGEIYSNTFSNPGKNGIFVHNNSDIAIYNNTINSPKERGIVVGSYDETTKTSYPATSTVEGNTVNSPEKDGILVTGGSTVTIKSNKINSAGANSNDPIAAIKVLENSTATITNNRDINSPKNGIIVSASMATISGNKITGATNNGMSLLSAKFGSSVTSNEIIHPAATGIYAESSEAKLTITDNTIVSPSKTGIILSNMTNGTSEVKNNMIDLPKERGILIGTIDEQTNEKKPVNATVEGNIIYSPTKDGILVTGGSTATIKNNKIDNAGANSSDPIAAIKVLENSTATITNNKEITSPKNGIIVSGSKATISDNKITGAKDNGMSLISVKSGTSATQNRIISPGAIGINANSSGDKLTINNNTITTPTKTGIILSDMTNSANEVNNNTITSPKERGILIGTVDEKTNTKHPANAKVEGNTINSPEKDGILVTGGSTATIKSNKVDKAGINSTDPIAAIKILENSTATITNNTEITSPKNGIVASSSKVTITGNKIEGAKENGMSLISVKSGSNATQNRIISPGAIGINANSSGDKLTINNNTITTPMKTGILLSDMTNSANEVNNNTITSPKERGICVGTVDKNNTKHPANAKVEGNTINSPEKDGILVTGGSTATIKSNKVDKAGINSTDPIAAIKILENSTATITNNTEITSPKNGIVASESMVKINGNTITGAKGKGVSLLSVKAGSSVTNNKINNPLDMGIFSEKSKVTINNNTITTSFNNGIHLNNPLTGTLVNKNTVTGSKNRGIVVLNSEKSVVDIKENKITDAVNDGIFAEKSTIHIEGNTTVNAPRTAEAKEKDIRLLDARTGSTLKNNKYGTRGFLVKDSIATGGGNTSIYAKVTGLTNKPYTGSAIKPVPVVKIVDSAHGITLDPKAVGPKQGRDYTVSYKNNVNVGTATVILKDPGTQKFREGVVYYPIETTATFKITKNQHTTHTWDAGKITKQPTTTATGVKTFTCTVCKATKTESIPKLKQVALRRISGGNRYKTSQAIAEAYMKETKQTKLNSIIVASGKTFPDALAGGYLAKAKNAPIIIWHEQLNKDVQTFIKQKVKPGGTVYILGGTIAVGESIKKNMGGYKFVRLADTSRYGTNLKILDAVGLNKAEVLVCDGGTDGKGINALIASATGRPLLLVDKKGLIPIQKTWLGKNKGKIAKFVIVGDGKSVPAKVENELKAYGTVTRISGKNGDEVSARVASTYYKDAKEVFTATMNDYPDGLCGGPLAIFVKGPILLVNDNINANSVKYANGLKNLTRVTAFGGNLALKDATIKKIAKNSNAGWTIIEK